MEFNRHGAGAPQAVRPTAQTADTTTVSKHNGLRGGRGGLGKWTRIGYAALLFATTILVVAIAALIAFGGNDESHFINTSKYQAVFINDGSQSGQSVYFGHIIKLTSSYLILQNIYYITSTQGSGSTTAGNYSLTKLGCQQLHDPYDQMVVSMNQVAFWENLQDTGKVVSAIKQFQKDNPNGPNCSQSTDTTSNTTPQNSGTTQNSATTQTPSTTQNSASTQSNTSTTTKR